MRKGGSKGEQCTETYRENTTRDREGEICQCMSEKKQSSVVCIGRYLLTITGLCASVFPTPAVHSERAFVPFPCGLSILS